MLLVVTQGSGARANLREPVPTAPPCRDNLKELGALVTTQHGIYAASRVLGHSDIRTTARHYADHTERISVGLGKLLNPAPLSVVATA